VTKGCLPAYCYYTTHSQSLPYCLNRKPRAARRGAFLLPHLDGGGAGLEGVEEVAGGADGVFFEKLAQNKGQDAAAQGAVYGESSCSGGLLPVSCLRS